MKHTIYKNEVYQVFTHYKEGTRDFNAFCTKESAFEYRDDRAQVEGVTFVQVVEVISETK
jgi:hypothetical protein